MDREMMAGGRPPGGWRGPALTASGQIRRGGASGQTVYRCSKALLSGVESTAPAFEDTDPRGKERATTCSEASVPPQGFRAVDRERTPNMLMYRSGSST